MNVIDEVTDILRQGWINSENGHADFPTEVTARRLQSTRQGTTRRYGISELIIDLRAALEQGPFGGPGDKSVRANGPRAGPMAIPAVELARTRCKRVGESFDRRSLTETQCGS
jgi:hypothetical protein